MMFNPYQQRTKSPSQTPWGPNTEGMPVYNPYLNADGSLNQMASIKSQPVAFQGVQAPSGDAMLKQFDANQNMAISQLKRNQNENRAQNLASLMTRGASSELLGRIQNNIGQQNMRNMNDFYAQSAANRYGVQDSIANRNLQTDMFNANNKMGVDRFNVGNDLASQQANLQTMLGENRYANASELEKYRLDKELQAAQVQADAMRKRGKGGGFLSNLLGGIGL